MLLRNFLKDSKKREPPASHNPNSLSHNDIRAILEDRDGMLWIGTEDGLIRFDKDTEEITYVMKDQDAQKVKNYSLNGYPLPLSTLACLLFYNG